MTNNITNKLISVLPIPTKKGYPWIPSLYFFQSIPYVVVTLIAAIMYQQKGLSNSQTTLITSLMMLPWAIKPLFSPLLENLFTKKHLTLLAELFISFIFFLLALCVNRHHFLIISTISLSFLALASSFHDIASDGVYLLNLNKQEQKKYLALRSIFYQTGRLVIKGGLLASVGYLALWSGMNEWCLFFIGLFFIAVFLTGFHHLNIPEIEQLSSTSETIIKPAYFSVFKTLLLSPKVYAALLFIFFYNFTEAQLQKIIPLFMLDSAGLNLTLSSVGEIYGILGTLCLMFGVFIGGLLISRFALSNCLKKFTLLTLTSHLLFFISFDTHHSFLTNGIILFNQFTFGLANSAYMGYLLIVANRSQFSMSMYTLCTAIMALSYVVFGAWSGFIQQRLSYSGFFLYIFLANILLLVMTYRVMTHDD